MSGEVVSLQKVRDLALVLRVALRTETGAIRRALTSGGKEVCGVQVTLRKAARGVLVSAALQVKGRSRHRDREGATRRFDVEEAAAVWVCGQ